jgi:hypothetical protein
MAGFDSTARPVIDPSMTMSPPDHATTIHGIHASGLRCLEGYSRGQIEV